MENASQEKFPGYPSIDAIGQKQFNKQAIRQPVKNPIELEDTNDTNDNVGTKSDTNINDIDNTIKASQNHVFYIEEKYDGSQLGFRLECNKLCYYNKNHPISISSSAFNKTVVMLDPIAEKCNPNYIYYGEAISRVKHNVNVYNRTPRYFFVLFDVYNTKSQSFLLPDEKKKEADRLGLECAALLYANTDLIISCQTREPDTLPKTEVLSRKTVEPVDICKDLLNKMVSGEITSSLGGMPEGVVVKWYNYYKKGKFINRRFKYVMDSFKERQKVKQPKATRTVTEFLQYIGSQFNVEARFRKAYQHLLERSELTDNAEENLRLLIAESNADLLKEYGTELKSYIWSEIMTDVKKYARSNLAAWYRENIGEFDTRPTTIPTDIEKTPDAVYIESVAQKYNTDERFQTIWETIKGGLGQVLHKNYMALINALDNDMDLKRKEIEDVVLPHYLPVIFAAANKDLQNVIN